MNGKENLFFEITTNNLEGEYILFSLRGFLQHLEKVEANIFSISDIFSKDDFDKVFGVFKFLKRFLRFILKNATIHKRPLLKALKGTYV